MFFYMHMHIHHTVNMGKKKAKKNKQAFGSEDAAASRWDSMLSRVAKMAKKSVPKSQRLGKSERAAAESKMAPADLQKREAEVLARFARMEGKGKEDGGNGHGKPKRARKVHEAGNQFHVKYHYNSPLPPTQKKAASCPSSKPVHVKAYCRRK